MNKLPVIKIALALGFSIYIMRQAAASQVCSLNMPNSCDVAISWFNSYNNPLFDLLVKNDPKSLYSSALLPNWEDYKKRVSKKNWVLKSIKRTDTHLGLSYSQFQVNNGGLDKTEIAVTQFDPAQFDSCETFLKEVASQPWLYAPAGSPYESEKSKFCRNPKDLNIMIPTIVRWFQSDSEVLLIGKETGRSTEYLCFVSQEDVEKHQLCNFISEG